LRRLVAYVKEEALGNDKCLKVRQKQLEQHSFTAQTNQPASQLNIPPSTVLTKFWFSSPY
jgi:hypothetical protein